VDAGVQRTGYSITISLIASTRRRRRKTAGSAWTSENPQGLFEPPTTFTTTRFICFVEGKFYREIDNLLLDVEERCKIIIYIYAKACFSTDLLVYVCTTFYTDTAPAAHPTSPTLIMMYTGSITVASFGDCLEVQYRAPNKMNQP
jgi:hypothetical protein